MGGEPDQSIGSGRRAGLGDREVVLPDVDAVGAGRRDQIGAVVENEESIVFVGGAAKWG